MPARNAARTLEQTVRGDPARLGRRDHPRRRQVDRRHVELARAAAAPRHLAPAQRRLRRQPEDVLPRGAPARRRRRGDAPPRRPVRAVADPRAGRRRSSPGEADLVLGSRLAEPGRGARRRDAAATSIVANRGLTTIENRVMRTRPVRAAHRLPRLLARPAAASSRSCATRSTSRSTPRC